MPTMLSCFHNKNIDSRRAYTSCFDSGMFFFTGPVLLLLSTIFEWVQGNFFPMMVCGIFAVFWLSFGVLQLPSWGLAAAYSATGNSAEGAASVGYNAAIALYLLAWGFALLTFFVFTLKTNAVFAMIFGFVTTASFILSAAYWRVAMADYVMAMALQKVCASSLNPWIWGLLTDICPL